MDYKSRLLSLHLLPLMHWLELQDITFLVKCLQQPTANPEIASLVSFSHSSTRAGQTGNKLKVKLNKTTSSRHFYTSRIVRLWNALPVEVIDLTKSFVTIKKWVREYLIQNFLQNFHPQNTCTFHLVCPCSKCHVKNILSIWVTSLFTLYYTVIHINICYVFIVVSVLLLSINYLIITFSFLTQFLHRLLVYICTFSYSYIGLVCQHSHLCIKTHDFCIALPDAVKPT